MKIRILYLLVIVSLLSCNKPINVFKTGVLQSKNYGDTVACYRDNEFIVLPVSIDGKPKKMLFDTGADLVALPKDGSNSNLKMSIRDSHSNVRECAVSPVHSLNISSSVVTNLYSLKLDFPSVFFCFSDGLLGNNVIKSSNWLLSKDKLIFSSVPFDIPEKQVSLAVFYYGSNGLHSNFLLNGNRMDTCLFDSGGLFDIELSKGYYDRNRTSFKPNRITYLAKSSFGVHGKSLPDTVTRLNCTISFNGFRMDSVDIVIKTKGENRIGLKFLRRFEKVAINNSDGQLLFGKIDGSRNSLPECLFSFDLIDGFFVVDSKILNVQESSIFNIGDKLVEINSIKSADFKSYCDFLVFRDNLTKSRYLELKTADNKMVKINNWRY